MWQNDGLIGVLKPSKVKVDLKGFTKPVNKNEKRIKALQAKKRLEAFKKHFRALEAEYRRIQNSPVPPSPEEEEALKKSAQTLVDLKDALMAALDEIGLK